VDLILRRLVNSRTAWALLLAGLAWVGWERALEGLARDPRFVASPGKWRTASAPSWGGAEVVAPVYEALEELGPINLFDPRFEERVRATLDRVPGVAGTRSVRRLWPDRYAVSVRLHRPFAVVRHGRRAIPVTAEGVVLPARAYARAAQGLPAIAGVDDPPPRAGAFWDSEPLRDGLATVAALGPHLHGMLAPLGIRAIDVAGARDPLRGVVLRARDATSVRWGRPRARVGENPPARKIAYLREAAQHLALVRGREIDVRYGAVYLRESSAP